MGLITLVRHGQASFGADNYDQLSELGLAQSQVLGEHFRSLDFTFDGVYCGALRRHQQTLAGIIQSANASNHVETHSGLNEFAFLEVIKAYLTKHQLPLPDKSGPRSDYYRLLKTAMLSWQNDELNDYGITETWTKFVERTTGVFKHISEQGHRHALVVSSGGVIGCVLSQVLKAPKTTAIDLNLQIKNASYSQCYSGRSGISLSEFNNVSCFQQSPNQHLITYS